MTELIEAVAPAWSAYKANVSAVFGPLRKHEEVAFIAGYQAALTAITDAGYRIVKDEPALGSIHNPDVTSPAAPGDEK
jgi:hypothetical protein